MNRTEPTVTIPTELMMALVKLLDVVPPVLEDWIKTTSYGEVNRRDRAALSAVNNATKLHRKWTNPEVLRSTMVTANEYVTDALEEWHKLQKGKFDGR